MKVRWQTEQRGARALTGSTEVVKEGGEGGRGVQRHG